MCRTDFWTLWEKARVGCFERTASKHVYYLGWNRSPAQVGCMRQVLGPGALGRPRGIGWRGRWEGGSGWGIHVTPWLIHVNVWQKPLQYCKVISLQLITINGEKKKRSYFFSFSLFRLLGLLKLSTEVFHIQLTYTVYCSCLTYEGCYSSLPRGHNQPLSKRPVICTGLSASDDGLWKQLKEELLRLEVHSMVMNKDNWPILWLSCTLILWSSKKSFITALPPPPHIHSTMLVKRQSTPADVPGSNTILKIALQWLLVSRWINKDFTCVKIKAYYLKKLTTFVLHFISTKCILIFPVTVVTKLHKAEI